MRIIRFTILMKGILCFPQQQLFATTSSIIGFERVLSINSIPSELLSLPD